MNHDALPWPRGPVLIGFLLLISCRVCAIGAEPVSVGHYGTTEQKVVDLVTGDVVSREDLLSTPRMGIQLNAVLPGSPAEACRLRKDDRIVAVDGVGFFGSGEWQLLPYHYQTNTTVHLLVRRADSLLSLATKVQADRKLGILSLNEDPPLFVDLLSSMGYPMDRDMKENLSFFPARVTGLLAAWLKSHQSEMKRNDKWLREFVALHTALVNQDYAAAVPVKEPIPIPFLERIARFYTAIAQENRDGEKDQPDWRAYGESARFFALFYPFPGFTCPAPGNVTTTDEKFNRLFNALFDDPVGSSRERSAAAQDYLNSGADGRGERFLNAVKASILAETYTGLLNPVSIPGDYDIATVGRGAPNPLRDELEKKLGSDKENRILILFALIAARSVNPPIDVGHQSPDFNAARSTVDEVFAASPYLAAYAILAIGNDPSYFLAYPLKFTRKPSKLFDWALEGKPTLTTAFYGRIVGAAGILRMDPRLVLQKIEGPKMTPDQELYNILLHANTHSDMPAVLRGVQEALARGADLHSSLFDESLTALSMAYLTGNLDIVKFLVQHGVRPDEAPSALCHATEEIAEYLLSAGADINAQRSAGKTPLASAALVGDFDRVRFLVAHGATVTPDLVGEAKQRAAQRADQIAYSRILRYLEAIAAGQQPKPPTTR